MLPLESPRWRELTTYYPGSDRLPGLLTSWVKSAGGNKARMIWHELVDSFLQQFTIKDAAYAVLPHVVAVLKQMPPKKRCEYLLDLGLIEAARLLPHAPRMPGDLAAAYKAGVQAARTLACECLTAGLSKPRFLYLLCTISNLSGHPKLGKILFHMGAGGEVEVEELAGSGYIEGHRGTSGRS